MQAFNNTQLYDTRSRVNYNKTCITKRKKYIKKGKDRGKTERRTYKEDDNENNNTQQPTKYTPKVKNRIQTNYKSVMIKLKRSHHMNNKHKIK